MVLRFAPGVGVDPVDSNSAFILAWRHQAAALAPHERRIGMRSTYQGSIKPELTGLS